MKKRILAVYIIILSIMMPMVIPSVSMAIDVPDSEFSIDSVRVYSNAVENNDLLYLIKYTASYSTGTAPADYTAENVLSMRMYDGTTYIDSTEPYSFGEVNDYGFNEGLMSLYFSADDVNDIGLDFDSDYTFILAGNPLVSWDTGTPPSISYTGPDYSFDGNAYSGIDIQIRFFISMLASDYEESWETDSGYLIDRSGDSPILTYYGETYFVSAIPELRRIAPSLFGTSIGSLYYDENINVLHSCSGSLPTISGSVYWLTPGTQYRAGQTFTADNTGYVGSIKTLVAKVGVGAGTITASIYNSINGSPSGTSLCHGIIDSTTWAVGQNWQTWNMGTPAKIIEGNEYALVLHAGTGNSTNKVLSRWNNGSCCDDENAIFYNKTLPWTQYAGYDMVYYIYVYDDNYGDEFADDIEDHSIFNLDSAADLFGTTPTVIAAAISFMIALFFLFKVRNETLSTGHTLDVLILVLVGMALIIPLPFAVIAVLGLILGLIMVWILFIKPSIA